MTPYRRSPGGRFMLLGMGLFFLTFGIGTVISDPGLILRVSAIIAMLGACAIVVSVALSLSRNEDNLKLTFWLCVFPFLVWLIGPEIWKSIYEPGPVRTISFVLGVISLLMASDPRPQIEEKPVEN